MESELYPDEEQRRRIMDFIMAAGQTLLENGAEVFRVEQTMEFMARSFHLREFHVYVLTNGIFASAGTAERFCPQRPRPLRPLRGHLSQRERQDVTGRPLAPPLGELAKPQALTERAKRANHFQSA